MACATSVRINLDHGLKTQLCTGAKQIGKICDGARHTTRECGSENGKYMSHLKYFRVKRKKKVIAKQHNYDGQVWPVGNKLDGKLIPNSK